MNYHDFDFDAPFGMNNEDEYAFGIDFGTSSSLAAVYDGQNRLSLADYSGENRNGIPSLFYRSRDGQEFCAEKAKGPGKLDPSNVCRSVKMKLSEPQIVLNGYSYSPTYIAEKLAKHIINLSVDAFAQDFIDFEPERARIVCGVPVRFNAAEHGQILQIMRSATGSSTVELLAEPILAALAYDYFLKRTDMRPVLTFDCGAGTFDVAVLQKTPNGRTPYTVCDGSDGLRIAGDHLDELMAELILEKLRKAPGNLDLSLFFNPKTADYYYFREWQAREMKEALSENDSYTMTITSVDGGRSSCITVTRAEFEAKIRPSVQSMVDKAADVLNAAKIGNKPSISILMVGGSCRIPLARQLLAEKFSWISSRDIMLRNPEKMVALGAALYANRAAQILEPKVAFGYAVNTYAAVTDYKREMLDVRIPSDAHLPTRVTSYYHTRFEGQTSVAFRIYEVSHGKTGEMLELNEGRVMGITYRIEHQFGRSVPKGTNVQLTTELSADGVLSMTVDDISISKNPTTKVFTISNTCQAGE